MSNVHNPKPLRSRTAVLACAGNNTNGELGDRLARRLQKEGLAEMYNLAQIQARISSSSRLAIASKVLVINGCHSGCASECMKELGYSDFETWDVREHLDLDGREVTEEDIENALTLVKKRLGLQ